MSDEVVDVTFGEMVEDAAAELTRLLTTFRITINGEADLPRVLGDLSDSPLGRLVTTAFAIGHATAVRIEERKREWVRKDFSDLQNALATAKLKLFTVKANKEDVWFWDYGGENHPESLSCPIVMAPETLTKIQEDAARLATTAARDEIDRLRKVAADLREELNARKAMLDEHVGPQVLPVASPTPGQEMQVVVPVAPTVIDWEARGDHDPSVAHRKSLAERQSIRATEEREPLYAETLKRLLVGTTPGTWRTCTCDKCGLIWSLEFDVLICSVTLPDDDGPSVSREQMIRNRGAIAYLMNHAQELVRLLEARDAFAADYAAANVVASKVWTRGQDLDAKIASLEKKLARLSEHERDAGTGVQPKADK